MRDRVRVLVIDNLAVEAVRREVYRNLAKTFGCDVHLLVPTQWRETRETVACEPEEGNAIQVHRSRILFGFRHQRVVYVDLARTLRMVRPHFILAAAQPESYAGAQVCIDRRLYAARAPLALFSSRNIDYPRLGFPYKFKFSHRLCDGITRRLQPDLCFYKPQAAGDLLRAYARRLIYLPHVVDCSIFRRRIEEPARRSEQPVLIGYVGRLVKDKGVFVLLEAMKQLPAHVHLVLVGSGTGEARLREAIIESGLQARVEILPPVPYREIPAVLNRLDVLALPSLETEHWTELFGRILIEAMACELPIVASRSGGIPEVIADAGVLVEPGDRRALAVALRRVCEDASARRDLGRKARERALRCFDIPVVAHTLGKEIMESVALAFEEGNVR